MGASNKGFAMSLHALEFLLCGVCPPSRWESVFVDITVSISGRSGQVYISSQRWFFYREVKWTKETGVRHSDVWKTRSSLAVTARERWRLVYRRDFSKEKVTDLDKWHPLLMGFLKRKGGSRFKVKFSGSQTSKDRDPVVPENSTGNSETPWPMESSRTEGRCWRNGVVKRVAFCVLHQKQLRIWHFSNLVGKSPWWDQIKMWNRHPGLIKCLSIFKQITSTWEMGWGNGILCVRKKL